ncbi:isopenicillin N synthase family oxygenase [Nocardia terpenica]|uniref:isopenicillin N synthase family dioxygenase n=1 Tax=Nocardia terpenica TaxID=455432 RepID=UPI002FE0264E
MSEQVSKNITQLPVIDVSAFGAEGSSDRERDEVAEQLDASLREIGFFFLTGHGVRAATREAMFAATREFFALPLERKEAIAISRSPIHRGYVGLASETLDSANPVAGDLKEFLDTAGEQGPDHPEVVAGTPLFGPNQFPDLPGFRAAWERYRSEGIAAIERVQRAMARALGLPDEYLLELPGGETMYYMRNAHYPPQHTHPPTEGQLGCGAHTDYGAVTLLVEEGSGGLQVMRRDGEWIDVAIPSDLFVVNLGDMIPILTNGRWVSNPHRVISPPDRHRYSVGLFAVPPFHANIACLPNFLGPGETPRYKPQIAGEYLLSRFDATHSYRNPRLASRVE